MYHGRYLTCNAAVLLLLNVSEQTTFASLRSLPDPGSHQQPPR